MLPAIYTDAGVRVITPVCPQRQRLGIGFDIPGMLPWRVAITPEAAEFLLGELASYISSFAGSQSSGSELIPSEPMSVPSEGVNT